MSRHSTLPTLFDDCKTVSIAFLKKHNYLEPFGKRWGEITWSRNGVKTGSIGIGVNMYLEQPALTFDYKSDDKPKNYEVKLVQRSSNLGKGIIWYFECPKTGKLCRKLFLVAGYFLHRSAFTGCFYEKQTYSHNNRQLNKIYENYFGSDHAYEAIYSKHFRKVYNGKPTKAYSRLLKKIRWSEAINESTILSHL